MNHAKKTKHRSKQEQEKILVKQDRLLRRKVKYVIKVKHDFSSLDNDS